MATGTFIFLIIGGVGVAVLLLALLGTGIVHLGFPGVDGPVTVETAAGFVGTLGFAGAVVSELMGAETVPEILAAGGIGALAAIPVGILVLRFSRAAENMPTDATPNRDHLVGALGVVVTPVPTTGYGEVRVNLGGHPVKLNAKADQPIPAGAQIFVVQALSETSVQVEPY